MEDTFDFGMMRGGITFCGVYDGHAGTRAVNVGSSSFKPPPPLKSHLSLSSLPMHNTCACFTYFCAHGFVTMPKILLAACIHMMCAIPWRFSSARTACIEMMRATMLPAARVTFCTLLYLVCTDAQGQARGIARCGDQRHGIE
jgi:hypothetical protein